MYALVLSVHSVSLLDYKLDTESYCLSFLNLPTILNNVPYALDTETMVSDLYLPPETNLSTTLESH